MKKLKWWLVIFVSLASIIASAYFEIRLPERPSRWHESEPANDGPQEVQTFQNAVRSKVVRVENMELRATNETGEAMRGSAVSFFAQIHGTDANGAQATENVTEGVRVQTASGAILLGARVAAVAMNCPDFLTLTVTYKDMQKSFAYRCFSQNAVSSGPKALIGPLANSMSPSYEPAGLVEEGGKSLCIEAMQCLKEMVASAAEEGVSILFASGFRSYDRQAALYKDALEKRGPSQTISAMPGFSEHQSGYAADLSTPSEKGRLEESFSRTDAFAWLAKHAHEYGFVLRYGDGSELITQYSYEPWHYRFIGKDLATQYFQEGWKTLEEFLSQRR
ncbi:MAG: M15 family metallopeptidase [Eubacteriaceae bacterium]|nr:M15 family metallopeptidase [Eubacteriaceae bacterium]